MKRLDKSWMYRASWDGYETLNFWSRVGLLVKLQDIFSGTTPFEEGRQL